MGIESKLIELYRNGLEVFANKEELNYRSTSGIPKKEDIDFLKKYKNEIVTILNKDSINSSCVLGDNEIPLTEIQSAYLLGRENHFELGGVSSHVYMEVRLPLLEKSRTEDVWNNIIKEHEALRSIFTSNNTQKILKRDLYYTVEFNEGIGINGKVNSTRERLKGKRYKTNIWPLFDIVVSQVDNYSLLHLSFDFLILDWTSIWILLKEFENNYFNNVTISNSIYNLKEIRMSQLSLKKSSKYLSDKEFWESRIPTLPSSPILPIQNTTIQDKFERMQIKADTIKWTKIKSNLAKLGFTQTSFLITIMAIMINNWSSNSKFSLNLTTMNRPKKYDGIDIVNDFTATSLLKVEVNNKQLFCDLLEKIQEQIIDDLKHETFTGVETIREIRKNTAKRNSIFPFVFTSALGVSSSDYKYIHLQEEGLSETPQVFMDCQVMEVNQELIVNFDLRSGVFSKELSNSIVKSYFGLLNYFSNLESFNKLISDVYKENGLNNNKKAFNKEQLKQSHYGWNINKDSNNLVINTDDEKLDFDSTDSYNKKVNQLCNIARKLLGSENISPDADLYSYGADSLLLAQLAREIIDSFSVSIEDSKLRFDEIYRSLLKKPTLKNIADTMESKELDNLENITKNNNFNNCELKLFNEGQDVLKVILFDSFGTVDNMKNILDMLLENNTNSTIATFSVIDADSYCSMEEDDLFLSISNMCFDAIVKSNYKEIQLIGFQTGGILAIDVASKLLKKGMSLKKSILVDSFPIQNYMINDEMIEKEFLKRFGITNEIMLKYANNCVSDYIGLQKEQEKRLKKYAKIIYQEKRFDHDFIFKTFNVHEKTLRSFNVNLSPYIGEVEVILNEKYMIDHDISYDQIIKKWKEICLGVFKSNEIKVNSGYCEEEIDNIILKSMI